MTIYVFPWSISYVVSSYGEEHWMKKAYLQDSIIFRVFGIYSKFMYM